MFAPISGAIGTAPIQFFGLVADSAAREEPGRLMTAVDPYWGTGEFIYAKANGTIRRQGLCVITPAFNSTTGVWDYNVTEVPNTANLGRALCVSMVNMTSGQFGWFMLSGLVPINGTADVAADTAFGITAAGQVGAIANGKQILNARVAAPSTTTVAKANCTADASSTKLQVPNADGWFPGAYLSGTGIAATTYVVSVDPGGRSVVLSTATSAAVAGTVTATYNNATIYYNVAHLNRAFAQGQIT